jgi:hypothetical protein
MVFSLKTGAEGICDNDSSVFLSNFSELSSLFMFSNASPPGIAPSGVLPEIKEFSEFSNAEFNSPVDALI